MVTPPLTVLQLTHQGFGAGSTQSIFSLSTHLARRGHRVLVGCPPATLLARLVQADPSGVEHVPVEFTGTRDAARIVETLVARERVDVVNSHATRDRRACTWLRWQRRLPEALVVTRRTMPRTLPPALLAIGLTADRTIAVSRAVAEAMRRGGHPPARVRVVPNGIDLERVDAPADLHDARRALGDTDSAPIVLVMARRKDQDVLVRALSSIQRPVVLACVGIEPDGRLRGALGGVPARHRVRFVPFTERALAFYHLAAVVALPSRIEGLSQALLEAMSLGLPVVASDAGGNTDLIRTGITGELVRPLDPAAWARAIEALLADPAYAHKVGQAGRTLVRQDYALHRTVERTEVVYREALERRRLLRAEALR